MCIYLCLCVCSEKPSVNLFFWGGFRWHAIIVDGHSVEELCKAISQSRHQPTAIIAKTIKGKGIPGIFLPITSKSINTDITQYILIKKTLLRSVAEDKMGWHGKVLLKDMAETVLRDLQSHILNSNKRMYPASPIEDAPPVSLRNVRMPSAPNYKPGEKVRVQVKEWMDDMLV